jgi:hypothetical protein
LPTVFLKKEAPNPLSLVTYGWGGRREEKEKENSSRALM